MIAEVKPEYKVSVVREALEVAMSSYASAARAFPYWRFPPFTFGPDARSVADLLRAAWLSLPKCLVCGAEDGQNGRVLVRQYMAPLWRLGHVGPEWSEPVCTACRLHPSISVFEEF